MKASVRVTIRTKAQKAAVAKRKKKLAIEVTKKYPLRGKFPRFMWGDKSGQKLMQEKCEAELNAWREIWDIHQRLTAGDPTSSNRDTRCFHRKKLEAAFVALRTAWNKVNR